MPFRSWAAPRRAALLALLLLFVGALDLRAQDVAPAEEGEPAAVTSVPAEDPELVWARIQQDELPAWTARREVAEARSAEARAFFGGGSSLRAAFPSLADGPLALVGWLDSQLVRLEEAEAQRALLRARPAPTLGDDERVASWLAARQATLDAEDSAALLERRMLLSLRALARERPELAGAGFAAEAERLSARLAELSVQAQEATGDERGALLQRIDALVLRQERLKDQATRARLAVLRPGDRGVLDPADIGRLGPGPEGEGAADRLRRVRQMLPDDLRATVDAALERYVAEVEAPRREAEQKRKETETQAAAAEAANRAELARREAERAAADAQDDEGRRIAALLDEVADAEAQSQATWDATREGEAQTEQMEGEWADRIAAIEAELAALAGMPTGLGSDRRLRASKQWRELQSWLSDLRDEALVAGTEMESEEDKAEAARAEILDERTRVVEARAWVRDLPEGPDQFAVIDSIEQWDKSLEERLRAWSQRVDGAVHHRDQTFQTLRGAKELRERLRPFVPRGVRADRNLVSEVTQEVQLLGPNVRALVRRRGHALADLPLLLQDPDRLLALLVGSFWILLALATWFLLRAAAPKWTGATLERIAARRTGLFPLELGPLRGPAAATAVAAIDLVALSLLLGPTRQRMPELAIALMLARVVALFRLVDNGFHLLVAPSSEHRPALMVFSREAWPLVARAERLLLLWVLLGAVVQYLVRDVVGADAVALLIARGFQLALLGLVASLLHLAEPHVRRTLQREAPDGGLKRRLTAEDSAWITRAPRAFVGIVWFLGLRSWQLLQGNIDENTTLGTMLNLVNRRRLTQGREESAVEPPAIPTTLRRGLSASVEAVEVPQIYGEVVEKADAALDAWRDEEGRGLVLLIGDRGHGKHAFVNHWAEPAAERRGLPLRRAELSPRLLDSDELLRVLARGLGLEDITDERSFIHAVKGLEPTLFVIEEVEAAFLRRVGGFSALRTLFRVLASVCEKHFWLVTAHAPAWRLLERVGTVVSANTFRGVLELPRLGGASLQRLLVERTRRLGHEVDFGGLTSGPGGQPAAERERTTEAFFRLLAEASGGNVGVALPLWAASLSPNGDGQPLRVRLPGVIANPSLPPLSDWGLLTLAAVRVHGGLNVDELVATNNLERDLVQTTVQVLDNLDLLERGPGRRYRVRMAVLAAVTRLLRRRHFVYGKE